MRHYGIRTPTRSYHTHNERQRTPSLIRALETGKSVALVTDAGTPLLSDPGRSLVTKALERGIQVIAIPGPSAVLAALVTSGLAQTEFTFLGFPPNRSNSRKKWFLSVSDESRPLVVFEAPHRIGRSLTDMMEVLGDREIAVCREMTKIHEELAKGPISEVLARVKDKKGEFTIVVSPTRNHHNRSIDRIDPGIIVEEFGRIAEQVGTRREAVRLLANRYGLPSRDIYRFLEDHKTD